MTLEEKLNYNFKDKTLLPRVLTLAHGGRRASYERLEFLGDRVLGLIVADLLLKQYPKEKEGDIAKRFVSLVREETLAKQAKIFNLSAYLKTKEEELRQNDSILSDVFEALTGALFIDGGLDVAQGFIIPLFEPLVKQGEQPPVDSKTMLQEWGHQRKLLLPVYTVIEKTGPDHAPHFKIQVQMDGFPPIIGEGSSKRLAEQNAAFLFLQRNAS